MKGAQFLKYIFIIIFLVPIIIGAIGVNRYANDKQIVENGIETLAEVVDASTSTSVNGVDYYKVQVRYLDLDGIERISWTSEVYTLGEIDDYITIMYDPETFKATKPNIDISDYLFYFIFLGIFAILELLSLIVLGKDIYRFIMNKQAKEHGVETDAEFVTSGSGLRVNDTTYYFIKFKYTDNSGKEHTIKTKTQYTGPEVKFFEKKRKFSIKYVKGFATIIEPIDLSKIDFDSVPSTTQDIFGTMFQPSTPEQPKELLKICQYCGSQVDADTPICPHCSGNEFKYVDKEDLIEK